MAYNFVPKRIRKARAELILKSPKHYTQAMRDAEEKKGHTMPGGGFPIANTADLARAKRAFGRAGNKSAARKWINSRAADLGAAPLGGSVGKRLQIWHKPGGRLIIDHTPEEGEKTVEKTYRLVLEPDEPKIEMIAKVDVLSEVAKGNTPIPLKDGLVWGWASMIEKDGKRIRDHQGDEVDEDELMKAAHDYVTTSRQGGAMHIYKDDKSGEPLKCGSVVESLVFSRGLQKALGIDLPHVGWLIGYKIEDADVKKAVADGTLKSFSIGGSGTRVALSA